MSAGLLFHLQPAAVFNSSVMNWSGHRCIRRRFEGTAVPPSETGYYRSSGNPGRKPITLMNPSTFHTPPASVARRHALQVVVCALTLASITIFWWLFFTERPAERVLHEAQAALAQGDFSTARQLANEFLERTPDSAKALLLKGQASIYLGLATEAERALRAAISQDSKNREAHLSLVRLLKIEGRFWDMQPHARFLLESGDSGSEFLIPLAAPDGCWLSEDELSLARSFGTTVPDDASPLLGIARAFLQNANTDHGTTILQQIVTSDPENIEAQALYGTMVLDDHDESQYLKWHQQLPSTADSHPEIWFLRGAWARRRELPRVAIRCLLEAVLRNPNHRRANLFLSQLLISSGETANAKPFTERFELLEEVARLATRGDDSSGAGMTPKAMHRISELMEKLGRLREAVGWSQHVLSHDARFPDTRRQLNELIDRIDDTTPLTLTTANPARHVDLTAYPLPDWQSYEGGRQSPSKFSYDQPQLAFSDKAESLGLNFTFHNAADPASGRARMFEFSGGGVAVLDYDGDLWPDLYLTQGSPWPQTSAKFRDSLFRNVDGGRFDNVVDSSNLGDERYGQGATVGDFDNDGFPDLCVANIGVNRLYHNNGDGTFTDIGEDLGTGGNEWTVSCLLADVNNDSLPDLYYVNYLGGHDVFDRVCQRDGLPIQCPLYLFPSKQDQLYLNLGDGRFENATKNSGIIVPDGKGMGIVAASFKRPGRLSLFVANDDKPNFYFVDNSKSSDEPVSYSDNGILSGLAFGDFGTAQSCMGIAAGDVNNDGQLDLFVTNFAAEHNNLYVQKPGGVFEDLSRRSGLHVPTLQPMGWGSQFIDGDLDGLLDIFVANGHLDENTSGALWYRMRAQYFRNLGDLRFEEVLPDRLGPYFEHKRAGRAVARIDWNRDGADDVCVTQVELPVALLSNETLERGHFLSIRLRGIKGSRDAIGSVVRIRAGMKSWFRHLTAGDGFQASNERKLTFGFGDREIVDELTIYWPSGFEQTLPAPELDTNVLIIEGQQPRVLSKQRHATLGRDSD